MITISNLTHLIFQNFHLTAAVSTAVKLNDYSKKIWKSHLAIFTKLSYLT